MTVYESFQPMRSVQVSGKSGSVVATGWTQGEHVDDFGAEIQCLDRKESRRWCWVSCFPINQPWLVPP